MVVFGIFIRPDILYILLRICVFIKIITLIDKMCFRICYFVPEFIYQDNL